jgi:type IV pilus assembly protein PilV
MSDLNLTTRQRGSFILEALIAILIFTVGILGLIALQGTAISTTTDTRYRVEANQFANRILSAIQGSVNRTSAAAFQASLNSFASQPGGGDLPNGCTFTGAALSGVAPGNDIVSAWRNDLNASGSRLPSADAQVQVTWGAGTANQVRIIVCWLQPGLPVARRHVIVGSIS